MSPEIQPTSYLDLAGVVVAIPAAGLVKMKVLVFLGVVLICLACVGARLPWVLDEVAASVIYFLKYGHGRATADRGGVAPLVIGSAYQKLTSVRRVSIFRSLFLRGSFRLPP